MNKSLLEYFETSDTTSYLVKIEDIDVNIFPYRLVWEYSKNELTSDFLNMVSIHPEKWFDEMIPIISKFDYVQLTTQSFIIRFNEDDDLKMTSFTSEPRRFSSIEEIKKYLDDTKSRFKRTALRSINKIIIISDDLQTNQVIWQIKSAEFDFDLKFQRDKKIDHILNI